MNRYLIPFLFIFFISCPDQRTDNNTDEQNKPGLKKSDLEGHWKFVTVRIAEDASFLRNYPEPAAAEQNIELPYTGTSLIFENDSVYEIEYPIALGRGVHYSVGSGYLFRQLDFDVKDSFPVQMVNDTLFIYKNSYSGYYLKEGYIKTSFNDSILNLIKRYDANYPELAGTWFLIREFGMNDGSEPWKLKFPHEIPDSIMITREDFITTFKKNRVYMMSTDGKKRDYGYSYCGSGNLCLTPGKWYKGEDPWIHFHRK